MAISKAPKSRNPNETDLIKSDVASFASSIGLSSSSLPKSSFDDSDFRKSGPLKPTKTPKPLPPKTPPSSRNPKFQKRTQNPSHHSRPNPLFDSSKSPQNRTNGQDLPKLPLMKASALSGQWHVDAAELESKVLGEGGGRNIGDRNVKEVMRLAPEKKGLAQRLLEQYANDYESSRGTSGDIRLVAATQRSGTAKDKVAAFTCMVDDNPIANVRSLDALLALVTSKVGKRHALTGFDALMDLFLSRLLPDRKLKTLMQQPLNHLPESKDGHSLLLFWYWEECLKQRYEKFVVALDEASKDMLPVLKDKALKTIYSLLTKKPEQERRLLSVLVNKLGDPVRKAVPSLGKAEKKGKAASDAVFHLLNLLYEHPNMKVNFLSQIRLSKGGDGPKIAKRLMDVYFALFKVLTTEARGDEKMEKSKKEDKRLSKGFQHGKRESPVDTNVEMDSRLLVALLTGVKRAFPYVASAEAEDLVEVQTPMLFKLVHSKNFNVGVQALMLLYDISSKNQIASDRFYRALYSKLPIPAVMHSSKSEMFLQLLVKAMKNDINLKRVSAFSKRLLQVALQQPPQYACGCLLILSDILKARPALWNMMLQNETVDEDFEHFEDIIEESQNAVDITPSKQEDTVKFVCTTNDDSGVSPSESEDDVHPPASSEVEDDGSEDNLIGAAGLTNVEKSEAVSGHDGGQAQLLKKSSLLPGGYNPQHREPSYSNADRTSWWELVVLASHVHPSVATMARTLLSGAHIVYNGNPLTDLSLAAFLDKFMEKKPKLNRRADGIWHGGSQIAPARKLDVGNQLIGEDILSLAEEDVPPEDLVFHKFYMNKTSSSKKLKKKKQAEDEAAEELFDVAGSDESDNEEIEDMLGSSHLPLEKEGDYDYDDLDEVANEGDDDLIGNGSDGDGDVDSPNDDFGVDDGDRYEDDDDDDGGIGGWDGDGGDDFSLLGGNSKKRKRGGKSKASPFANLEDYDHLLKDNTNDNVNDGKKQKKSRRKSG
ncbi:hypothetical protein AAC387_Pa03g1495 [Persea americana]